MADQTVAIVGLGLIGGSLARDLAALGHQVLGFDRDPATVAAAQADGCIRGAPGADGPSGDPFRGIEEADVVVLAVPVSTAPGVLRGLAPRLGASLVTDVGSNKRSIVAAAGAAGLGDRFVGSHPLAGDHRSGWEASRPGLFRGARVFLCPARVEEGGAEERRRVLESALALWRSVGAEPEVVGAAEHDERMAWVSHLPQAAVSALGAALSRAGRDASELGPGGRDSTRLAASSPALWADILLDNADLVAPGLAALEEELARLRAALGQRDGAELQRLLAEARAWKQRGG